jgi:hypothetical protein
MGAGALPGEAADAQTVGCGWSQSQDFAVGGVLLLEDTRIKSACEGSWTRSIGKWPGRNRRGGPPQRPVDRTPRPGQSKRNCVFNARPARVAQALIKPVGIKNQSSGKVLRSHSRLSEHGLAQ